MVEKNFRGAALLREWRRSQEPRVRQLDLAKKLGYRDATPIVRYEAGDRPLPVSCLFVLKSLTGIPIRTLAWKRQHAEIARIERSTQ